MYCDNVKEVLHILESTCTVSQSKPAPLVNNAGRKNVIMQGVLLT